MYRWILFLSIPCTQRLVLLTCTLVLLTSFLLNIANAFQIWSMLAGYEELAKTFEPIRDGENYEKKKNNCRRARASPRRILGEVVSSTS